MITTAYDQSVTDLLQTVSEEFEKVRDDQGELEAVLHVHAMIGELLQQWKTELPSVVFPDSETEIHFFKHIKPRLLSKYYYYDNLLRLLVNEPIGDAGQTKLYYQRQRTVYDNIRHRHSKLFMYVKAGNTERDTHYFTRRRLSDMNTDAAFTTVADSQLARHMAATETLLYIEERMRKGDPKATQEMQWTAPKSALIELIYAIHAAGAVNKGTVDLKQLTKEFEVIFQVSLGNVYRVFQDIRQRKINQTVFLDELKENLIRRANEMDR